MIRCPGCREFHRLGFGPVDDFGLTWTEGEPWTVVHVCPHCGHYTRDHDKDDLLAEENGAHWMPTAPGRSKPRSYWISSLYVPFGLGDSWEDIARSWEQAQGDETEMKSLYNTSLGLPYEGITETPEWEFTYNRAQDHGHRRGVVPEGGCFITVGVDVGKRYCVYEVLAHGRHPETSAPLQQEPHGPRHHRLVPGDRVRAGLAP